MNSQIRHHADQATRWADDAARAMQRGDLCDAARCREQAHKHQVFMRKLQAAEVARLAGDKQPA